MSPKIASYRPEGLREYLWSMMKLCIHTYVAMYHELLLENLTVSMDNSVDKQGKYKTYVPVFVLSLTEKRDNNSQKNCITYKLKKPMSSNLQSYL